MARDSQHDALRHTIRTARTKHGISLAALMSMCEAHSGRSFATKRSNVQKFLHGVDIDAGDVAMLRAFFLFSETGRLLSGGRPEARIAIAELLKSLSGQNHQAEAARHFEGPFLAYHGSYMQPGHYVIRAFQFDQLGGGAIHVTDHLKDNVVSPFANTTIRAAGALTFFAGKPYILLERQDNAVGYNLIVGDDLHVTGADVALFAQMHGLNRKNEHFSRAVLLRNRPGGTLASAIAATGIFPLAEATEEAQRELAHLRRSVPKTAFPDPAMDSGGKASRPSRQSRR